MPYQDPDLDFQANAAAQLNAATYAAFYAQSEPTNSGTALAMLARALRSGPLVLVDIVGARIVSAEFGIEKTAGVCGGAARIALTRIPVWTLVRFRQLGASDANILSFYPSLTADDLANAWHYESEHPDEIAALILQNEA